MRAPDVRVVASRLRAVYPRTRHHNLRDPFWEAVFIVLSAKTSEGSYRASFARLRSRYRTQKRLAAARIRDVERLIEGAGLGHRKALQVVAIARGLPSATRLRVLSDSDLECTLSSLPGIGPKSARCIAMYSLDRAAFPVDAHALRIMRRLGYTSRTRVTPSVGDQLQSLVPKDIRAAFHIDLLSHGRTVCLARKARCGSCPLADLCPGRSG